MMADIINLATHVHPFVTVKELAAYCLVSDATIYRHIEKGALFAIHIGGSVRIRIEDARDYAGNPPDNGRG